METLFLKLVSMSMTAGLLVGVVVLLRLLLRAAKAPKWLSCALWVLVAVRLLCPISLESKLSAVPPAIADGTVVSHWVEEPSQEREEPDAVGRPEVPAEPQVDTAGVRWSWTALFSQIWLLGAAALLAYAGLSYGRLRRKVAEAVPVGQGLWSCKLVETPFILGLFRPRIYLPTGLDEELQKAVVAHEQAHLSRRDHWWKPLGFLLLSVYWFNPALWVAYVLLCRDIELACDEKVVRTLGMAEKKRYSSALLSLSVPRRQISACPLAFGEVGVKERVKHVLNYKRPAFWVLVTAVIACIAVALCFLTNPKQDGKLLVDGVLYLQEGRPQDSMPNGSRQIGRIAGIEEGENGLPTQEYYGVGLKKNYAHLPLFQETDAREVLWLPTSDGFLAFRRVPEETTEPNYETEQWLDFKDPSQPTPEEKQREIALPEFPGVTFRWTPEKVSAVQDDRETELFYGMPVMSVYFADLNGDGLREICSDVAYGSGVIDQRIEVYDWANQKGYTLADRMLWDYTLRMENGVLLVEQRAYQHTDAAELPVSEKGVLALKDGALCVVRPEGGVVRELDAAIREAVLYHGQEIGTSGFLWEESHRILHQVREGDKLTVYVQVLYERFTPVSNGLSRRGSRGTPAALTFRVKEDGTCALLNYWEPQSGQNLSEALAGSFPPEALEQMKQVRTEELAEENRKKATEQMEALGGPDAFADALDPVRHGGPRQTYVPAPRSWAESDIQSRQEAKILPEQGWVQLNMTSAERGWLTVCINEGIGWADTYIYRTVDGGRRWNEVGRLEEAQWIPNCAVFPDDDHGVIAFGVFQDAPVFRTEDGGETWQQVTFPLKGEWEVVGLTGNGRYLTAEVRCVDQRLENRFLRSEDYGATWEERTETR